MRLLVPLLMLTGLLAATTGLFQMVARDVGSGCEFPCQQGHQVDNALASAVWFCIAIAVWGIAGVLKWMERRFERLDI